MQQHLKRLAWASEGDQGDKAPWILNFDISYEFFSRKCSSLSRKC